jgi:hypothetical protein
MTITTETVGTKPSTLIDLIQQVIEAFGLMGDSTPILVGRRYLNQGAGAPPHVVFCPEAPGTGGRIGPAIYMGDPAVFVHGCEVHVRGRDSGGDVNRWQEAYRLTDRVVSCIQAAGTGRLEWGPNSDGSPTDTDFLGCEVVLSFQYSRDILHDAARWRLPAATEISETSDDYRSGTAALGLTVNPTTTPTTS